MSQKLARLVVTGSGLHALLSIIGFGAGMFLLRERLPNTRVSRQSSCEDCG